MHENGIMMKKVKTIEPVSEIIFSIRDLIYSVVEKNY